MVIMKMNTVLVKHSKVLFSVITIIIIISFVWFFTPGTDGSLLFSAGRSNKIAGRIFDTDITRNELSAHISSRALVLASFRGGNPQNYLGEVSVDALPHYAMLLTARKLGITISDDELIGYIKQMPIFMNDSNVFDPAHYALFEQNLLIPNRLTKHDFEEAIRSALTVAFLPQRFSETALVTSGEVDEMIMIALGGVQYRLVSFSYENMVQGLTFSEQDLLNFHNANPASFMAEPTVNAEIAVFLNSDYQSENPAADAQRAAAEFREELYQLAEKRENTDLGKIFIDTAQKHNIKIIKVNNVFLSAKELDGIGAEPSLIAALHALEEYTPITRGTIKGVNGSYVAFLQSRTESAVAPFDEVREQVLEAKRKAEGQRLAAEAVRMLSFALLESKDPGKELEALVTARKGTVSEQKSFFLAEGLASEVAFISVISLITPTGTLSAPVPGQAGSLSMIFVDSRTAPDEERAKNERDIFEQQALFSKRQAIAASLEQWIFSHLVSYIKQDESSERY